MKLANTVLTLVLASLSAISGAATISLNTGTAANGSVLAAGTLDSFWSISTDGVNFSSARVAYPGSYPDMGSGQTCCGMETVNASAAWITTQSSTADSPVTGWGIGPTVYARRTFDLTGFDLNTVALSGLWRIADSSRGIFINDTLVPGTDRHDVYTFGSDFSASLGAGSSLFHAGINTIEMRGYSVNNV